MTSTSSGPGAVQVIIRFRQCGETADREVSLSAAQYFDDADDPGLGIDGVPKFDHAHYYLGLDKKDLENTYIEIVDQERQQQRRIQERYWDGGRCALIESSDSVAGVSDLEMILEVETAKGEWHVIRLRGTSSWLEPVSHHRIRQNEDGSQSEIDLLT